MEKIYTYEYCKSIVSKYTLLKDLRENNMGVYDAIGRNKWYELKTELRKTRYRPKGYSYEECKEIALRYKVLKDFRENENKAYCMINKKHWKELLSHLKISGSKYYRIIYAYEFPSLNSVYIGLTYNIRIRNNEHHIRGTLFNFAKEKNISFYEPIILEENVLYDEAGKREDFYMEKYKSDGWSLINKAPAGSIGGDVLKKEDVVCFDFNGILLKICGIKEMCEYANISLELLRICLRGTNKSSGNKRFMTKEQWISIGSPKNINPWMPPNIMKEIAVLDKNLNFIEKFPTKKEAAYFVGYTSTNNNMAALKERCILNAKGYKICYYEDYKKYLNGEFLIYKPQIPKNKKSIFIKKEEKNDFNFLKKFFIKSGWEKNRLDKEHNKAMLDPNKEKRPQINYERYFDQ